MEKQDIIMNFEAAPTADDIAVMAKSVLENLPDEYADHIAELPELVVEDIAEDILVTDFDLDHPYDLPALYKSGKEISPGIERKDGGEEDKLIMYRRPILDIWCEGGDRLINVVRTVIVEEIGANFDFTEDEIEDFIARYG